MRSIDNELASFGNTYFNAADKETHTGSGAVEESETEVGVTKTVSVGAGMGATVTVTCHRKGVKTVCHGGCLW